MRSMREAHSTDPKRVEALKSHRFDTVLSEVGLCALRLEGRQIRICELSSSAVRGEARLASLIRSGVNLPGCLGSGARGTSLIPARQPVDEFNADGRCVPPERPAFTRSDRTTRDPQQKFIGDLADGDASDLRAAI
jgi:hypothetical protein